MVKTKVAPKVEPEVEFEVPAEHLSAFVAALAGAVGEPVCGRADRPGVSAAGTTLFVPADWAGAARAIDLDGLDAAALGAARREAAEAIERAATAARAAVAGTSDPVKLAEYADKATSADRILAGEGADDMLAEARKEAVSLGLASDLANADPADVAGVWRKRAAALRGARADLNAIVREQLTAIDRRTSLRGVGEARELALGAIAAFVADASKRSRAPAAKPLAALQHAARE